MTRVNELKQKGERYLSGEDLRIVGIETPDFPVKLVYYNPCFSPLGYSSINIFGTIECPAGNALVWTSIAGWPDLVEMT